MWFERLGAGSPVGPSLCALGSVALACGVVAHGILRWPTILATRPERDGRPPAFSERLSVHMLIYGVWAAGFGAVVWRGVPPGAIDVRFAFERRWPVIAAAEWIYLSVYFVPLAMPWLPVSRGALRRYSLHLWVLLAISLGCFLLPLGVPPRPFVPASLAGEILAWETNRADFAAASLPSFHVFWGLLVGSLLATCGGVAALLGRAWAVAVALSCIATGAHALADVAASLLIYAVVAARVDATALRPEARPIRNPAIAPSASPPSPK